MLLRRVVSWLIVQRRCGVIKLLHMQAVLCHLVVVVHLLVLLVDGRSPLLLLLHPVVSLDGRHSVLLAWRLD